MTIAAVQVSKRGVDVADVIDRLDSFYAQNVVNALWADVVSILSNAAVALDALIDAYQTFLDLARAKDDVSYLLVLNLLATELHRRADIEATLARP